VPTPSSRGKLDLIMKDAKSKMQPTGNPTPARPTGLTTEIQARIGHQLRAMYEEVVRQGVPERFSDLIRRLDEPGATPTGESKAEGSE
jgi:Anti-sigma factor NepR